MLEANQEVRVMVRRPGSESALTSHRRLLWRCDRPATQPRWSTCGDPRWPKAVRRHVSALGADDRPQFQYLKWQGEQAVVGSGVPYVILRPSLIFGPGDEFTTAVAALVRTMPIVPVIGSGNNRLQPIHVDDVARCIALSVSGNIRGNHTIEIGGPEQLSYNEIVGTVARTLGRKARRVNVPVWKMRLPVAIMEKLTPRAPINRAMLQLVTLRNVAEPNSVERAFGFRPRPLYGNIDHVRNITAGQALRINLGLAPGG